ncbi:ChaN family lipoprotein [Pseudoduganella violaceinigra]|uniref:ChaN family lipoprotein n=1 Tax=Pseudoduganella violaceinigra TaxID=246602 RepID=UPI00040B81F1|nr:ChaN family lipoprotein [Pseudoduganella violaceinigra]
MKPYTFALLLAGLALAGCSSKETVAYTAPSAASNPQVLLLGEVHDNKEGHKLRFEDLRQRVEAGWRPAIAMEQFDRETQAMLDEAQKGCLDASCLITVMGKKGWDWQQYYPVIQLALNNKLPLIAANLSRNDASKVVRDGVASSFDAATISAYKLKDALPSDLRRGQEKAIQEGHCNMVSDLMLPGMVNAQVARDIWMAKLIRQQQPRDVVLIAGNGHVRKDIGVPRWLNAIEPKLTVRAIGFVEPDGIQGSYDEIRKVPAQKRTDPCAKFK